MKLPLGSVVAAVLLCGCGNLHPLYQNTSANPTKSIVQPAGCALAFIEFGEQGSYQDPSQLQNAVDLIKRTSRPLVITYVHGWHHGAGSADVGKFSEWLTQISETQLIKNSGLHVIGVYLGWRGEITKTPIIRQFSTAGRPRRNDWRVISIVTTLLPPSPRPHAKRTDREGNTRS
jgi:hypothetical protein